MKLSLFVKLFSAVLFSSVLVIAGMAVFVQWSFQRGLENYLYELEVAQLERLAPAFEKLYQKHGDWSVFCGNRRFIYRVIRGALRDAPNFQEEESADIENLVEEETPDKRPALYALLPRLRILDEDKQVISGRLNISEEETLHPLYHQGELIGWLGLRRGHEIIDQLALGFRKQQTRNYYLSAFLALLISAFSAWLLTRQLLGPIRRIAAAAGELGKGRYKTRVRQESGDELGRLADDFNQLAHALERNEQTRRAWIADISHELRTPLAVLRGEIEAVQDGVRPLGTERIKSLHHEILALGKLVDDLYELALSDAGALAYQRETLNLPALLEETAAAFDARFAAKGIHLRANVHADKNSTVFADARRLRQLFGNVLENSLRYTDPGGCVIIKLERAAAWFFISVEDSPPGVPPEALPKLFERLYRVDKSRSRELGGCGLGLAICRNIVEAHGGKINAYLSPSGGLGVRIELKAG